MGSETPGLMRAIELLRNREMLTRGGPRLAELRACIAILNDECVAIARRTPPREVPSAGHRCAVCAAHHRNGPCTRSCPCYDADVPDILAAPQQTTGEAWPGEAPDCIGECERGKCGRCWPVRTPVPPTATPMQTTGEACSVPVCEWEAAHRQVIGLVRNWANEQVEEDGPQTTKAERALILLVLSHDKDPRLPQAVIATGILDASEGIGRLATDPVQP